MGAKDWLIFSGLGIEFKSFRRNEFRIVSRETASIETKFFAENITLMESYRCFQSLLTSLAHTTRRVGPSIKWRSKFLNVRTLKCTFVFKVKKQYFFKFTVPETE